MNRTIRAHRAPAAVAALCLAAGLALAACSSGTTGTTSDSSAGGAGDGVGSSLADGVDAPGAANAPDADVARDASTAGHRGRTQKRAVIAHGEVVLRAADVADTRTDVRRVVARYGGEVAGEQTDSDDDGEAVTARLVLRVPSAHFDDAMGDLRRVAELAHAGSDTKDVTTKVIDTRVRLRAQRRSVARVEQLLDRAQDLRDIVLIESELSRRQAALDSLEQQSAYLADQTSMSTISVEVDRLETAAKEHEDRTGFLGGLAAGWHGLTVVAVGLATALGAVLPFLVVLAVLLLAAWPFLRALRRRRGTPSGPEVATEA
jgi:hypothetical protein